MLYLRWAARWAHGIQGYTLFSRRDRRIIQESTSTCHCKISAAKTTIIAASQPGTTTNTGSPNPIPTTQPQPVPDSTDRSSYPPQQQSDLTPTLNFFTSFLTTFVFGMELRNTVNKNNRQVHKELQIQLRI